MASYSIDVDGVDETQAMLEESKPETAAYRVSANTDYAVYVEFGTKYMEAQPYLRPAVHQTMRNASTYAKQSDSVDEFVESLAEEAAKKARKKAPVDTGRLRDSITVEKL